MAKMTVVGEDVDINNYQKYKFVEFLEVICRLAVYYFDEFDKDLPFTKRLEQVLDDVLTIKGLERREPIVKTVIDSDCNVSDEDY